MSTDDAVDLDVLAQMDEVLGGASETDDLLAEFLSSADAWTLAVANQTTPGDTSDGHRAAHTLATSASMVGARALGRAAREIEHALAHGTVPDDATRQALTAMLADARAVWIRVGRAK